MKEFMIVVGCEIVDNGWMELTLTPLTLVKKKNVNLMDLASGNLDSLLASVSGVKQYKTKMYVTSETWDGMKLCIGKHVSLELLPDKTNEVTK
jgi:hypothetical protein